MLELSATTARRLAILKQHLAGPFPVASSATLLDVARAIRCIQVDPISAVARTQHLVLYSRLGPGYRPHHLDELTWETKELFHYWAHAASLVLTEDFPIHGFRMRRWGRGDSEWSQRARRWMKENEALRRRILKRLRDEGPLRSRDFEDLAREQWRSGGWYDGRNVGRMLEALWSRGKLMIAGRLGQDRVWDLAERWFPSWVPDERLTERQMADRAALLSLKGLGIATPRHINLHFVRGFYPGLPAALARLERRGEIARVSIDGGMGPWKGRWYIAADDIDSARALTEDSWQPRTSLLSPFDNLICDRSRTKLMFDFDYTIEIYVPKNKRRFGYYVLPILYGDRIIGRVDSRFDRERKVYVVEHVYAEPGAPRDRATGQAVRAAFEGMAEWLGAEGLKLGQAEAWKSALR